MRADGRPEKQRIPRPPTVAPGGPAPWASRRPASGWHIPLEQVRQVVVENEPRRHPPPPGSRPASVLIPLFEEDGEARVVLTRRTTTLPSHQGEVSFPGGKADEGEESLAAALREAHEEIGLEASAVEVIGELDHLSTVASKFTLAPFVGVVDGRPVLHPNPAEVDAVLDVGLADLLDDGSYREEVWQMGQLGPPWSGERPMYFFDLEEDTVWGATARILYQLLDLVSR